MRAKFINEINFERTKNPKEYMGIGKISKYKKLYMDLYKYMPGIFSINILNLEITNEIPMPGFYSISENYKKIRNFFKNNPDFGFERIKGNILFIREIDKDLKESLNFDRNGNTLDKLKIGRKNIELKFEDLKIGENYKTTVLGEPEYNEEDLIFNSKVLDKDVDSILVCDLIDLDYIKKLADKNNVNLTLNFISEIGIEDSELDELLYVYDHVNNHIETVMGYKIKFNYLE